MPKHSSGSATHAAHGARPHRKLKIALIIIAALLAVVVAVAAWYVSALNAALASGQSDGAAVSEVLTPAKSGEPYYVLILGSDSREGSGTSTSAAESGDQQRSDVMILARIDEANSQVTLVSIPRDTRWEHDGTVSKINEAYNIGGAALSMQVVENLTGVSISHCVEISFSGLENLVDFLGGVEVNVPQDISYKDALTGEIISISAGQQTLNGQEAQIFARVRKAYTGTGQDSARQSNIRTLISAITDKIKQQPFYELPGTFLQVADCFGTDMRAGDLFSLAKSFMGGSFKMYSGTGPTLGDNDPDNGNLWLVYDNPEGWACVMDVVEAGGDPSKVDPNTEMEDASYVAGVGVVHSSDAVDSAA